MLAMPDRLSDPPRAKRNSGRTGRRRMTAAQAALSGQHAVADHRRRYGQQGPTSVMPALPGPPAWFSPELIEIWRATVGAAPQGMRASKVLAITPYDRTRITIPPPPRAEPVDDPWATLRRYPTVIDGG